VEPSHDSAAPPRSGSPPPAIYGNAQDQLGFPPGSGPSFASGQEQTDCIKELTNKIAWVLGSTYKKTYASKKGPVHTLAARVAKGIVRTSGYSKSK